MNYLEYDKEYGTQQRTKLENELHFGLEDLSNVTKMMLMERQRKLNSKRNYTVFMVDYVICPPL